MITSETLENWFTHHPPQPMDYAAYEKIRDAAKSFSKIILKYAPDSADRTAAIRKVREAVMTANAAIACKDGNNGYY